MQAIACAPPAADRTRRPAMRGAEPFPSRPWVLSARRPMARPSSLDLDTHAHWSNAGQVSWNPRSLGRTRCKFGGRERSNLVSTHAPNLGVGTAEDAVHIRESTLRTHGTPTHDIVVGLTCTFLDPQRHPGTCRPNGHHISGSLALCSWNFVISVFVFYSVCSSRRQPARHTWPVRGLQACPATQIYDGASGVLARVLAKPQHVQFRRHAIFGSVGALPQWLNTDGSHSVAEAGVRFSAGLD